MSFFEFLNWSPEDRRSLFTSVRKCTGAWSTEKPEIIRLRTRLLELQGYRCAYCQIPIISDTVGARELDHILPKDGNANHLDEKKISELEEDRYCTYGYPQWQFEPRNIALICKPCNSSKSTYDSLNKRAAGKTLKRYPSEVRFNCYHPHYHCYTTHIEIDENFIYSYLTEKGRVLLKICGLTKVEVLEKKFAPAACMITLPGRELYAVVASLVDNIERKCFGLSHAINALKANRKLTETEASDLIERGKNCVSEEDIKELKKACGNLEIRMVSSRKISDEAAIRKALK